MDQVKIGKFISELRKEEGLTQKTLAEKLGVTDRAISKWENGRGMPDFSNVKSLCDILNISFNEFIEGERIVKESYQKKLEENLEDVFEHSEKLTKKNRYFTAAVIAVTFLIAVAAIWCSVFRTQQFKSVIQFKERTSTGSFVYVEKDGHLLTLKCKDNTDFDSVQADCETRYLLDCTWNRLTMQGTVKNCTSTDEILLGTPMDVGYEIEFESLFGYSEVYYTYENVYPNPNKKGYLSDVRFWIGSPEYQPTMQTLLYVNDCISVTTADVDDDSEKEVVVRTRWDEKPCIIYDWDGAEITMTWLDEIPNQLTEQLWREWDR